MVFTDKYWVSVFVWLRTMLFWTGHFSVGFIYWMTLVIVTWRSVTTQDDITMGIWQQALNAYGPQALLGYGATKEGRKQSLPEAIHPWDGRTWGTDVDSNVVSALTCHGTQERKQGGILAKSWGEVPRSYTDRNSSVQHSRQWDNREAEREGG